MEVVLTAEDAKKAVETGVSGVIVSNHGDRQLDYSPATITVLEEANFIDKYIFNLSTHKKMATFALSICNYIKSLQIVQAVCGKIPVLFDGGIRRGTDIFKALALGAKAVMDGRPVVYGLAAKGESGVRKVLKMLKDELELTMALTGCPTLKDITRAHISSERERLRSLL